MDNTILLRNIDIFCKSKGILKADLLRDLNLNSGIISNWKARGNLPSVDVVIAIAKYFGVSVNFLLTNEDTEIDDDIILVIAKLSQLSKEEREPIVEIINNQVDFWLKKKK